MNLNLVISSLEQFHFIRPEWLWGLPVATLLWWLLKEQRGDQQWSSYIPKEMLSALKVSTSTQSTLWIWSLLLLSLGMITAAAGPSWDKQSAPTAQNQRALVLVLDLSPSMLAQDLSPDRLTRAKYKLIDVLRQKEDGQIALIAYAGDAHTVSPLTDDPRTIEALLPALHPNVMPSAGSNTEAAIELAQQLLIDAGLSSGQILLISDGVADDAIKNVSDSIDSNYRLSVLAVGGNDATPIPAANGGFIRKASGEIVLSKVNAKAMRTMASSLGGRFSALSADNTDITTLQVNTFEATQTEQTRESSIVYDTWVDMGHWLVLLILPFALLLFRKGALYLLPFCLTMLMFAPNEAYAADSFWKDLWQTRDQQAVKQLKNGDYGAAADTFEREDWSAIANYRNGAYDEAISQLSQFEDTKSLYNKANALAFSGQLKEALESYDKALALDPSNQDALHNKSIIEQLLQNQEQDSEGSDESDSKDSQSQNQDQDSSQESESKESESQSSESENSQDQAAQENQTQDPSEPPSAPEPETNESDEAGSETAADEQPAEAEPKQEEQASAETGDAENEPTDSPSGEVTVSDTDQPLKDSSEQWLRAIQDDPSGLLRRKFDYQAQQRAQQNGRRASENAKQERY